MHKKQVERHMLPPNVTLIFVFFTDESPSSRFAWKLASTLVTLTRTSTKKFWIFKFNYYLFSIYCLLGSICTQEPKRRSHSTHFIRFKQMFSIIKKQLHSFKTTYSILHSFQNTDSTQFKWIISMIFEKNDFIRLVLRDNKCLCQNI